MKYMDDITDITRLKAIAADDSIEIPENLADEIATGTNAAGFLGENPIRKPRMALLLACAAASLALLVGIGSGSRWNVRQPEDTFTDPYLAYAELEEAFSLISRKMDKGRTTVQQVETVLIRTNEIMEKVN